MDKQKTFENLNLNENIVKGVYLYGFKNPSPIQIKGIESINTGKDSLLQSQSGTGKTATYLLGVLNRIEENDKVQGIIICPTRLLCEQVYDVAVELAKETKISIEKCIGGTNLNRDKLRKSNLIISTLGRLHHMITDKYILLHNIKMLCLDEADDLLADGINEKFNYVIEKLPIGTQMILISATMNSQVFNFSKKFMHEPNKVLLKNFEVVVDLISQFYIDIESEDQKFDALLDLYQLMSTSQAIIFCNTTKKVDWLKENLEKNNFTITAIHSGYSQEQNNTIMTEFREGKTRLLLTTDILARGIDIPEVNLVVNYDLPISKETYIHRIGRCGRFGKKGVSISMVKSQDQTDIKTLKIMKQSYKMDIKEMPNDIEKYIS
jgi:superfamily II DNA/RNA helicase